jgi:adenylate cyclase
MPGEDEPPRAAGGSLDPHEVIELLESYLLGGEPTLTGPEIAAEVGIPMDVARMRWRSLGFQAVDDDEVAFTQADLEAMRLTQRLSELGLADSEDESALIRTLGRSYARLAEWQLDLLAQMVDPTTTTLEELTAVVGDLLPMAEQIQAYVWRRHTISAAARFLLGPGANEDTPNTAIGFADIVGYTRQSRSLKRDELARLVDEFESQAQAIITAHGGRIIKTIGDEVLFAVDTAPDAAEIALQLVEARREDPDFPELRVGLAWGRVLSRLGDVFGPTVNMAARLTSTARPGKVVVDRELADALASDERYRLRRMRRQSVRGYRRLEPWRLRRAEEHDLPGAAAYLQEKGKDLLRAVDEVQSRVEGAAAGEALQERPSRQPPGPVVTPHQHHR